METMTLKINYTTLNFKSCKKWKTKPKQTKPVLSDPDVKKYQQESHPKFYDVTTDKASKKFAFTCRKYYLLELSVEVSPN